MNKINVGFIGCGRISDLHFLSYKDIPDVNLYSICTKEQDVLDKRKKEWGVKKGFLDYREMLQDDNLDAVEILTPQFLHEEMVVEAVRAKKHIALQKPMSTDLESADRILETVKRSDKVFKITENYVFYPPIMLAKKMIDDGVIGTPHNLRIKMFAGSSGGWDVPDKAWEWRKEEAKVGRPMQTYDHGHHLWSVAWFLLGKIERVVSWIDSVDGVIDSPAVMMWKYESDARYGMCEYCYSSDLYIPSDYYSCDEWFEVTGSKGMIIIRRCTGHILNRCPPLSLFTSEGWKNDFDVDSDWGAGFKGASFNFINTIKGKEKPFLSGEEGREILEFDLAMQDSSHQRKEIVLSKEK